MRRSSRLSHKGILHRSRSLEAVECSDYAAAFSCFRTGSEIVAVLPTELNTLRNLFQFYEYQLQRDRSRSSLAADGPASINSTPLSSSTRHFIRADDDLAGFALVNRNASEVDACDAVWRMKEFFIMRRYRHASVGYRAAHMVIGQHPGAWEVTETPNNTAAMRVLAKRAPHLCIQGGDLGGSEMGSAALQRISTRLPEPPPMPEPPPTPMPVPEPSPEPPPTDPIPLRGPRSKRR